VVQGQRSGIQRKSERETESQAAQAPEVSQPGEPAEIEADAVGNRIAESLHGNDRAQHIDAARPGKERAPAMGAKLDPTKVHLAGKNPLRGPKKDQLGHGPETNAVHVGNAAQAGVQQPPQHHVFPQEERAWFASRGVDVDAYCVNLDEAHHYAVHRLDWNARIMKALRDAESVKPKGQRLTVGEMLTIVRPIMAAVQIASLPFVKYGSPRPEKNP
jgi:hypothetical protein